MTLLDAPAFDQTRSRSRRRLFVGSLCLCGVIALVVCFCWNMPAERTANRFLAAVEAQDYPKAFGIWNNDVDWQLHAQRYAQAGYSYGRFVVDWGPDSDYGRITSHKIRHSKSNGNGTLLAVEINGREQALLTLAVANRSHAMTFTPFALVAVNSGFGWDNWQITYQ